MDFQETKMDKFFATDGEPLILHIWEPKTVDAVIFAIHGGLAHAGDYVTPAKFFMEHGFCTIAPDLRGHKKEKVDIKKFDLYVQDSLDVLKWIREHYPQKPIYIMGHSMGGLIATIMGLKFPTKMEEIKGFVFSSPYYRNAVKVAKILEVLSGFLAFILPKMKVPTEDFVDFLTHDEEITKRHREDENKGLRGKFVTVRWANEILKAQKYVDKHISEWKFPAYYVLSGQDKLTDTPAAKQMISRIKSDLVKLRIEPDNYHENFNELNREEIFKDIFEWMKQLV